MQNHIEASYQSPPSAAVKAFLVTRPQVAAVTGLTLLMLAAGVLIAARFGDFFMSMQPNMHGSMENMHGAMHSGMKRQIGTQNLPAALQFIDMMVPHHEGAVEMAKIAKERSTRTEILSMADDIMQSQSDEILMMKELRRAWYGSDVTPAMNQMPMLHGQGGASDERGHGEHGSMTSPMMMDMAAEVETLRAAPEPFDKAFIDSMIPHHQSAIDAAKAMLSENPPSELEALATEIIRDQELEIEQMRRWREAWYPTNVK